MITTDMPGTEVNTHRDTSQFSAYAPTLETLLSDRKEESKLQKSRTILGEVATKMNDDELQTTITEFEFLGNEWLDEFEKKIFDGKTLQELLQMR